MTIDTIQLQLTTEETNLLLEALGTLPFIKVYTLIGKIQSQASAQLAASSAAPEPHAVAETGG